MTDERITFELRELERWFRSHPQPELGPASRDVLKSAVRGALNDSGLGASQVHDAPAELKHRLKAAVRRELAEQQSGVKRFPLFSLRRSSAWLSSAAALVFVVLGFGLRSRNVENGTSAPVPAIQM